MKQSLHTTYHLADLSEQTETVHVGDKREPAGVHTDTSSGQKQTVLPYSNQKLVWLGIFRLFSVNKILGDRKIRLRVAAVAVA